jgi:hypothetical protein
MDSASPGLAHGFGWSITVIVGLGWAIHPRRRAWPKRCVLESGSETRPERDSDPHLTVPWSLPLQEWSLPSQEWSLPSQEGCMSLRHCERPKARSNPENADLSGSPRPLRGLAMTAVWSASLSAGASLPGLTGSPRPLRGLAMTAIGSASLPAGASLPPLSGSPRPLRGLATARASRSDLLAGTSLPAATGWPAPRQPRRRAPRAD